MIYEAVLLRVTVSHTADELYALATYYNDGASQGQYGLVRDKNGQVVGYILRCWVTGGALRATIETSCPID